jgi:CheY-like chemotaxis protein
MAPSTRLLYVDDEPVLLEIGKLFLEADGEFVVDTVMSGKDALAQLSIIEYDAVISDYQMPGMNGIELLKQLKASGNTTPVIIFTGRGREIVIQALNEGADFYLQKGGDPKSQFAELSNKVRHAVSLRMSEEALGVSAFVEKEMEYHETELMKFYHQSLDAANKKLALISRITLQDISDQLTVLQLCHEMLEKKLPDPSNEEYLKMMGSATGRIFSIIRFTREYEKTGINTPVWSDISAIVEASKNDEVIGNLRLVNDLPAGTEVFADTLITRILYTFMDNSTRYGGTITTIRFSMQESGENLIIICENDGKGISSDEKMQIFDRGFGENSGLGLTLAGEILDITGITIKETSEPGKGARFEITVPKGMWRLGDKRD